MIKSIGIVAAIAAFFFGICGADAESSSYHSLWYYCCKSNGVNYYSGAAATFPSNQRPMAIYAKGKTYFVFGDSHHRAAIGSFDNQKREFSEAVQIGAIPDGDGHANPSLLIDENGYLYVFYGSHSTPTLVKRSKRPFDIGEWADGAPVEGLTTYPEPWQLEAGTIAVLHRCQVANECLRTSRDGAKSWSDPTTLIEVDDPKNKGVYAISVAETGEYPRKLHVIWTVLDFRTQVRRNFYYAVSDDGGATWKNSAGAAYTLPIHAESAEKIFDSGLDQVNTNDLTVDDNGKVWALVSSGAGSSWRWHILTPRSPGSWRSISLPAQGDHQFDIGALVVSPNTIRAYLPSSPTQKLLNGGDIVEWKSTSGNRWTQNVLTHSKFSHNNVKAVLNGRSDFRVFWSYGDAAYNPITQDGSMFAFGESNGLIKIREGSVDAHVR